MQNLESVETSTQVGCEDKKSPRRERKVCEDEYDYYDSMAVYGENDDEDDDDERKERSFEDVQELVNGSKKYCEEDNEE